MLLSSIRFDLVCACVALVALAKGPNGFLGDLWALEIPGYVLKEEYVPPPVVYTLNCMANYGSFSMILNNTRLVAEHNMSVASLQEQLLSLWFVKNISFTAAANQTTVCAWPSSTIAKPSIQFEITEWSAGRELSLAVPQSKVHIS